MFAKLFLVGALTTSSLANLVVLGPEELVNKFDKESKRREFRADLFA